MELNKIHLMDCMTGLPQIRDKSVDLILSDPPYGILECDWDMKLPLYEYFSQCNRVIKDNGAIVLTATMKFATELINANQRYFRYDLVWEKTMAGGFANANKMPMRSHELILVFYKHLPVYNPQGVTEINEPQKPKPTHTGRDYAYRTTSMAKPHIQKYTGYPRSVLKYSNGNHHTAHPAQKPLELFKYLILTYTNPNGLVLDTCMGSGTTAVACVETGRQFIGFEIYDKFVDIANRRILESKGIAL